MSGESGRPTKLVHGQCVRPEPVYQKSFYENVAGFINEVVLQSNSNTSHFEGKERITWVKFDHCDVNDLSQFKDKIERNGNAPPFLLLIGYLSGVQAWLIPATGEATEVFSWRQGAVRTLKVLISPTTSENYVDKYSLKRPVIAICDTAGTTQNFNSVSFISLLTGEQLKTIKFKSPVQDIYSSKSVVVISFVEKLAVFEATTFEDLFTVSTCYKNPGTSSNPIALGDQWLAFADRKLHNIHQSCGGVITEGASSYKSTVFQAAKSITKGIKEISETFATNLMGTPKSSSQQPQVSTNSSTTPGVVTIVDTQRVTTGEVNLGNSSCMGIVAHFLAHQGAPIAALEFDASGMLLATADNLAHNFHVFRIQPHPLSSSQAAVHHLYTLYRGDTTAQVLSMTFSLDSRWLAVATHRGTTHVYPITPYGGNVCWRTHKSLFVVNKLSRFECSAGLDDSPSSGRNSPVLSASPGVTKQAFECSPNVAYHNPFYPPYPLPTVIKPLVQLRQPLFQHLLEAGVKLIAVNDAGLRVGMKTRESIAPGPSPSHSPPSKSKTAVSDTIVKVALAFGATRGWLAGSPTVPRDSKKHIMDSLYVMAYHGCLIEYNLIPKVASNIPADKVTDYSPFELEVTAYAQWPLSRESMSAEVRYPLHPENPLLIPLNAQYGALNSPSQPIEQDDPEERWMAQVEINTHIGPSRRLWMGPQFSFKSLPGTGNLVGVVDYIEAEISDPSLEFPPRSSPVNMPGSKGVPVHIEASTITGSQSPRLVDRLSVDSDTSESDKVIAMSKLRHDLADAMQDQPSSLKCSGIQMSPHPVDDSCFDLSDVMDISCDPPGPCSDSFAGQHDLPVRQCDDDQLQAVTAKLHQVAVTSQFEDNSDMSPFQGTRTPSLEECRALTSSAEELASTLEHAKAKEDRKCYTWTPIDPPAFPSQSSPSPAPPSPAPSSSSSSSSRLNRMSSLHMDQRQSSPSKNVWCGRRSDDIRCVEEDLLKTSWSAIVVETKPSLAPPENDPFPPIGGIIVSNTGGSASKSATTSEDDLWTSKECKKDRKRRRKRNKVEEPQDLLGTSDPDLPPPIVCQPSASTEPLMSMASLEDSSPASLAIDPDHFHAAEEFHDPLEPMEEHLDPLQVIEDLGDDIRDDPIMLHSVHEGDDLARALEEASSDESLPVRTRKEAHTISREREADEMFPFRETSSDEDEVALRIRRRNVLPASCRSYLNYDEDDDRETSGDDRRTTSESDVTTSPNPRTSAAAKGKKKKKKKK